MKRILLPCIAIIAFATATNAQYYYKDILSNKQLLTEMALYKANKIHSIKIKSFEDDGEPSDGFFCEKKISRDYRKSEMVTKSNVSGLSFFIAYFDGNNRLLTTADSSDLSVSTNSYYYDEKNRIKNIVSVVRSNDDDFTNDIQEEHLYQYGEENIPVKMVRIKNKYDSTIILFLPDEKNNISIEKDSKSGSKFYYYYDAKNRLTDIAHANDFKPKLLADYLFEYDAAGHLIQMTNTEEGGNDYYVWKYSYDDELRVKEKLFTKERKLMGSIEYEYK